MAVLSMDSLPLGFRFRPTDEELINHYLRLKINGRNSEVQVIPEIDVCKWEPWDLPKLSVITSDDQEWFFFCPRDRKYPNGHRSNRATDAGYWKATGKDRTIKSRHYKSASNSTGQVGMKKTLVFYRGRAPKGERTSWIMHEYRPTQKDLDGTGPGQCPFVLFRLFHKPEEKADVLKYDELEQTGLSPTTTKSSPDEASSDIVQETATSGMQDEKQSEGIMRWLTDKSDNMTPDAPLLPVDSYMASDVEDHGAEETAMQGHLLMEENPVFYVPFGGEIDSKVFSPLHLQINAELEHNFGSPFNSDFGNYNNGLYFQDGTCEQDVSLTDLLDEFGNNTYESSCEGSTSQKNLVVGSETYLAGHTFMLPTTQPENSYLNGGWDNTDTKIGQHDLEMRASGLYDEQSDARALLQNLSVGYYQAEAQASLDDQKYRIGNTADEYSCCSFGEEFPVYSVNGMLNTPDGSTSWKNLDNHSGDHFGGTGIKIRARHPQQRPDADNFVNQGSAPRRLRLTMDNPSSGSIANDNVSDANYSKEEVEVHSTITEAREDIQQSPTSDEQEEGDAIFNVKEELFSRENSVNHGYDPVGRTRIRIKSRRPQQRSNSNSSVTQGTAPRRIRFQMNISPGSGDNSNVRDTGDGGEDEVQSTITEDREAIQQTLISDDEEKEPEKFNNEEEVTSRRNLVNYGSDLVGRNGIRIKARQPQQWFKSDDSVIQGSAPRRIRLQMNVSAGSADDSNVRDTNCGEEDEVQSNINETRETTEKMPNFDERYAECQLSKSDVNNKTAEDSPTELVDESSGTADESPKKLRVTGRENSLQSSHMKLSVPSKVLPKHHGLSSTFVISIGVPLAVTLFIAFSGIWIALRS